MLREHDESLSIPIPVCYDSGFCLYRRLRAFIWGKGRRGPNSNVSCESHMLDEPSRSDTIPVIVRSRLIDVDLGLEANIRSHFWWIHLLILWASSLSEYEARAMLVRGLVDPVSTALPLEYSCRIDQFDLVWNYIGSMWGGMRAWLCIFIGDCLAPTFRLDESKPSGTGNSGSKARPSGCLWNIGMMALLKSFSLRAGSFRIGRMLPVLSRTPC